MNCHSSKAPSPLRMLFILSLSAFVMLCAAWAQSSVSHSFIQSENISRIVQGKQFVDFTDTNRQVRASGDEWQMTHDGGQTWRGIPWPFAIEAPVRVAFHPKVSGHLFAASAEGDAAYFNGSTWFPVNLPPDSVLQGDKAPVVLIQATPSATRLLLGTAHGLQHANLPNVEDSGAPDLEAPVEWQVVDAPQVAVTALAIAPSGEQIAVGFASGLVALLKEDAESGLMVVSESIPAGYGVVSLAFHPENEEDLVVTVAASDDSATSGFRAVFHSQDSGQSWVPVQYPHQSVAELVALRIPLDDAVHIVFASLEGMATFLDEELLGQQVNSKQSPARLASVACRFTVTPAVHNVDHKGGRIRYRVDANSSTCTWRITSISSKVFLKVIKGDGRGDGEIVIDVAENSSNISRDFQISAANHRLQIRQNGKPGGGTGGNVLNCAVLSAQPLTVAATGGNVVANLRLNSHCGGGVRMQSNASFVEAPGALVTQASVTLRVAPNTSTQERRATVAVTGANGAAIQGAPINIVQRAAATPTTPCQPTLRSSRTSFPFSGGSADLTVTYAGSCTGSLSLETSAPFVTPRYPNLSIMGQQLGFDVAVNPNAVARIAQIKVRLGTAVSNELTITQDGQGATPPAPCIQQFHREIVVPASQREVLLTVNTNRSDCPWTVGAFSTLYPDKTWAVPASGSYTGTRQVRITLSGSPLQTRMGFFQVAGQTVKLIQRGTLPENPRCTSMSGSGVSIGLSGNNPTSSAGGEERLTISAVSGCAYTVSLSGTTSMIELLDPVRGVSDGVLRFRVLPNWTGMQRSVTFWVSHVGAAPAPSLTLRQFN